MPVTIDLLIDAVLIRGSSPKIFERGKTYAASGAVSITHEESDRWPVVRAEADGRHTYATRGDRFDSDVLSVAAYAAGFQLKIAFV